MRQLREAEKAKEVEVQAAIEASAEQKRREDAKELLAQKRFFEKMEADRIAGLQAYYDDIRSQLRRLHDMQVKIICGRHGYWLASREHDLAGLKLASMSSRRCAQTILLTQSKVIERSISAR